METRRQMFTEGLVAGVVGYVTIAVFYALLNVALGSSVWSTARLLGDGLVSQSVAESVPLAPVLAFNAVHLIAMLIVGLIVSWLVYETERHPDLWLLTFMGGLMALFFAEGFMLVVAEPAITILPWWSVVGANLVAGLAVGGYLLRSHRALLRTLKEMGPDDL
jgi:hypothetical protein